MTTNGSKPIPGPKGYPWKGKIFNRARFLFGNGLVLNEGAPWRHQRRLMQPAFQHKRIESLIPLMTGVIRRKLERWEEGGQPVPRIAIRSKNGVWMNLEKG